MLRNHNKSCNVTNSDWVQPIIVYNIIVYSIALGAAIALLAVFQHHSTLHF